MCDTACQDVCPVDAIFAEDMVPDGESEFIDLNERYFSDTGATRRRVNELADRTAPVE